LELTSAPSQLQGLTRAARTPDGREEAVGVADGTLAILVACQLKQLPLLLIHSLHERHNGIAGVLATGVVSGCMLVHTHMHEILTLPARIAATKCA